MSFKNGNRVEVNATCELTGDEDENLVGRRGTVIEVTSDGVVVKLDGDGAEGEFDDSELDEVEGEETFIVAGIIRESGHSGKDVFMHDPELTNIGGPSTGGGRWVTTKTTSKARADALLSVYEKVFDRAELKVQ